LKCRWAQQFSRPQIALAAGRMQKANLDYNQCGYQVRPRTFGAALAVGVEGEAVPVRMLRGDKDQMRNGCRRRRIQMTAWLHAA